MKPGYRLSALAVAALPLAAAAAENYLGVLRLPNSSLESPNGLYSFSSSPIAALASGSAADNTYRFKLGYKYSRYFAVETQFNDFSRPSEMFGSPASLASNFRSTGFGVDTIATLPVWRFSFYGRMGAYRGDGRNPFSAYSTSLLADNSSHGTRLRYGLGVRYEFTKAFGIHADVERYSPLGSPLAGEPESDLFSVGVNWRF